MSINLNFLLTAVGAVIFLILVIFLLKRGKGSSSQGSQHGRVDTEKQLYVGNLPYGVSERDLEDYFADFGAPTEVRVVRDRRTRRSKGFAFVAFSSSLEARKALDLDGSQMDGRTVVVRMAKPR